MLGDLGAWRLEAWRLGGFLVAPWVSWGPLGDILGPSWKALGGFLEPLGSILDVSWAVMGLLENFTKIFEFIFVPFLKRF